MLKKGVLAQLPYYYRPEWLDVVPLLEVLKNIYKVGVPDNWPMGTGDHQSSRSLLIGLNANIIPFKLNKTMNYGLQLSNFYIDELHQKVNIPDELLRWRAHICQHVSIMTL